MNYQLKKLILFIGDILALHVALALTLFVRYRLLSDNSGLSPYWQAHWHYFLGVFSIFILVFYINNLYSLRQITSVRRFGKQVLNSVITASLLAILYFYIYPRVDIAPKTNLAIFGIMSLLGVWAWRYISLRIMRSAAWRNKLAIIGNNGKINDLIADLKNNPCLCYQISLIFQDLTALPQLTDQIISQNIRTVILIDDFQGSTALSQALFSLLRYKINFISYADFYEQINQKVPVENIQQGWFLENLAEGSKNYFDFFKKTIDWLGGLIILIISLPIWPLLALAVRCSGRGPIIFTQNRIGKNGRHFTIYKFRSMRVDNNDFSATAKNDQRITTIGNFLRTSRLDEIPQLINILKGDMSFIGPRPERPELSAELEKQIPFYNTRLLIKPGLTGWDQISGEYHSPSPADTLKKLQNDLYYIKHRSLYLDVTIFLKTIATVIGRKGQ